jgi:hypothetical protein
MHTITSLRKSLGLSTTNQVRNRIEAVRDVLEPHLRRGPNNQILLTDEGLALLRQLQELYDSGLRMNEASDVLRTTSVAHRSTTPAAPSGFVRNQMIPGDAGSSSVRALEDEVAFLRGRVVDLETQLARPAAVRDPDETEDWWTTLREDLDVT